MNREVGSAINDNLYTRIREQGETVNVLRDEIKRLKNEISYVRRENAEYRPLKAFFRKLRKYAGMDDDLQQAFDALLLLIVLKQEEPDPEFDLMIKSFRKMK